MGKVHRLGAPGAELTRRHPITCWGYYLGESELDKPAFPLCKERAFQVNFHLSRSLDCEDGAIIALMGTTAIKNTFSPALGLPCHLLIVYPQTTVT